MSDGRVKRELRRGTAWSPGMPCAAADSGALLLAVLQQVDPTEPLAHGVLTADHTPVHRCVDVTAPHAAHSPLILATELRAAARPFPAHSGNRTFRLVAQSFHCPGTWRSPARVIGLKREPSGALEDVPENQLARDSF